MALTTPVHQETNLIGRVVNTAVTATSTTIYVQFTDSKTGVAREPQSNTLYFTFDKDNSRFEIIKCDSHTTTDDVTTLTVNAAGRAMPLFGIGAGGATGKTHPIGSQVGCVDVHWPYEIINNILDGSEGTSGTDFKVGDETDVDTTYYAWNGDANRPFVRYDAANNKWVFSNDGTTTTDVGGGTGSITAGDGIDIAAGVVSVDLKADSGLEISATELAVKLVATGGIDVGAAGLVLDLTEAGYTAGNLATVIADVTASSAEINQALDGISANVTDTNLNTLTAGPTSVASSLHTHQKTSGDYVYGDTIAVGDVLYLDYDDNKVKRITSSADTWKNIVGVALESGVDTNTGKLVLLEGLVEGASFSAVAPTFSGSGGAATLDLLKDVGANPVDRGYAFRLDNSAGPEAEIAVSGHSIRVKKVGTPTAALTLSIMLGDGTRPFCDHNGAATFVASNSAIIAAGAIAEIDIGNVYDDEVFTLSGIAKVPANSYVWFVIGTAAANDGVNYYQIEYTAAGTAAKGSDPAAAADHWDALTATPNYTLAVNSIDPWDPAYAIRAFGNGVTGGAGIGDSASADPWARVIGHVVSATEWYFDPKRASHDSGNFTDSWETGSTGAFYQNITAHFRPSWIDFDIEYSSTIAAHEYIPTHQHGVANYHTSNYDIEGVFGRSSGSAIAVELTPGNGTLALASVNNDLPDFQYYVAPLEQGFYMSTEICNDTVSDPIGGAATATDRTAFVSWKASQK